MPDYVPPVIRQNARCKREGACPLATNTPCEAHEAAMTPNSTNAFADRRREPGAERTSRCTDLCGGALGATLREYLGQKTRHIPVGRRRGGAGGYEGRVAGQDPCRPLRHTHRGPTWGVSAAKQPGQDNTSIRGGEASLVPYPWYVQEGGLAERAQRVEHLHTRTHARTRRPRPARATHASAQAGTCNASTMYL